ncbi:MAG: GNAT family N-acetyltransferase [Streptosporangiales bacterium]|nr:GNAT family N-acetyltransferase [Streptosporangiales bacterium]
MDDLGLHPGRRHDPRRHGQDLPSRPRQVTAPQDTRDQKSPRNFSTWTGAHGIYLEDLYVTPAYRKHGYGRRLLTALARTCVERGYARLEWSVLDWNEPAIGFYKSLGAVQMDEWTVHRLTGDALRTLGEA